MRVGVHFSQWRLGWRILREARHLNSAVSAFFGTHSSNLEIMGKYIFSEHESVFFCKSGVNQASSSAKGKYGFT